MKSKEELRASLYEELTDLEDRFGKLEAFILSEQFHELPVDARVDLSAQYAGMKMYLDALRRRHNKLVLGESR